MSELLKESKPWHWTFYRPEALMVYVLVGLGIYTLLQNQPELDAVRSFPLDDGSAIMIGHDRSTNPPKVALWRTGAQGDYRWLEELEDDFIPPLDNSAPQPVAAAQNNQLYLLTGQTTPFDQRLLTIQAINLEDGEVMWTNQEQPTGDAAFVSLHIWSGHLVTSHRAITDGGTKRLYVVGRDRQSGEMKWTKVYEYDPGLGPEELAEAVTYLPAGVLVRHRDLELLDMETGAVRKKWEGENAKYNGGWIFYRDSLSLNALPVEKLEETQVFSLSGSAPSRGFSGFYRGFPIHYSRALGWQRLQGDSLISSPFTGTIPPDIYPNCCNPLPMAARPHFLHDEWTRFIPLFLEPNAHDSIRARYPQAIKDPDLSGVHLSLLDNATLSPAFIGKRLEKAPRGVFLTEGKYHYFITSDPANDKRPVIVQIDGREGALTKAIRSSYDFGQLHAVRQDQPIGKRIWITSPRKQVALITPTLQIGTASSDSIAFEDVSAEYAEKWGLK